MQGRSGTKNSTPRRGGPGYAWSPPSTRPLSAEYESSSLLDATIPGSSRECGAPSPLPFNVLHPGYA
jgi:hypothetical protein